MLTWYLETIWQPNGAVGITYTVRRIFFFLVLVSYSSLEKDEFCLWKYTITVVTENCFMPVRQMQITSSCISVPVLGQRLEYQLLDELPTHGAWCMYMVCLMGCEGVCTCVNMCGQGACVPLVRVWPMVYARTCCVCRFAHDA
jgi:hypothetical protein